MTKLHVMTAAVRRGLINFERAERANLVRHPRPERTLRTVRSSCVIKIGSLGVASPPIA